MTASKEQAIKDLINSQVSEEQFCKSFDEMMKYFSSSDPSSKELMALIPESVFTLAKQEYLAARFDQDTLEFYNKHYNESELEQLTSFYSSSVYKKSQSLTVASIELEIKRGNKLFQDIQSEVTKAIKKNIEDECS